MLSSCLVLPRIGYLKQPLQIYDVAMVFDPSDPMVDKSLFEKKDWVSNEFGEIVGKRLHQICQSLVDKGS